MIRRYLIGLCIILIGIPAGLLSQKFGFPYYKAIFLAFAISGGAMQLSALMKEYGEHKLLDHRFQEAIQQIKATYRS